MRLYLLRSLPSPIVSTRWARFIHSYHRAFEAGPPPARVLLKPLRSYVDLRLGPAARFDLLRQHYILFRQLFSCECVQRVCSGEPIVVVDSARTSFRTRCAGSRRRPGSSGLGR